MTLKMIDSEENGKLVESIYKNILDKFEPGARQLITAGKAYLKALQGTSVAAKQYMEAVSRLAKQAQQGTWDATSDIGSTLLQFTDVYREIQQQHHHILKAFYVDVLVPLETNLEKDTKVIQNEQKKFQQQLRLRQDNYQKAIGNVKKQRKKTKTSRSPSNLEKELKNMQCLEDEKAKLDGFCEDSLRNALTQERIRYGFVLERQCSLAKHHLAYHSKGEKLLQRHLDEWHEVVKTRDYLPEHIQVMFGSGERPPPPPSSSMSNGLYGIQPMIPNGHLDHNLDDFFNEEHDDTLSMTLRKARSMDASSMDLRSLSEAIDPPDIVNGGPPCSAVNTSTMTRAKSDFNLSSSHQSLINKDASRPRSMMVPNDDGSSTTTSTNTTITTTVLTSNNRKKRPLSRALYSYLSSGEHQLSFHEGDSIALVGERNKGWQYGENLRTRRSGWFPVAYTQMVFDNNEDDDHTPTTSPRKHRALVNSSTFTAPSMSFDPFSLNYPQSNRSIPTSTSWSSQNHQNGKKMNWGSGVGDIYATTRDLGPPPPPPPPMPPGHFSESSSSSTYRYSHNQDTFSSAPSDSSTYSPELRGIHRSLTSPAPLRGIALNNSHNGKQNSITAATSLHSSNDSGFCNEINGSGSQQPDTDYCEDSTKKDNSNRENAFSTVKLRKTKTNDRSAPKIS